MHYLLYKSFKHLKNWLRPLFRPENSRTCHQEPNPSRTVSLTIPFQAWWLLSHDSYKKMRIFIPGFWHLTQVFSQFFIFICGYKLHCSSGAERSPGHELPCVAAEEALAERSLPAHQVHDGSRPEALLEKIALRCTRCSLLEIQRSSLTICIFVIDQNYVNAGCVMTSRAGQWAA